MTAIEVIEMKIRPSSDIERAMKQAEANLNVEGIVVTEQESELVRKSLRGEISYEEFIQRALELAKQ